MKIDAESVVLAIFAALFIGSGIYVHHLQRRLSDEVDVRQAAEARAALCESQIETLAREGIETAAPPAGRSARTGAAPPWKEARWVFGGDSCWRCAGAFRLRGKSAAASAAGCFETLHH